MVPLPPEVLFPIDFGAYLATLVDDSEPAKVAQVQASNVTLSQISLATLIGHS